MRGSGILLDWRRRLSVLGLLVLGLAVLLAGLTSLFAVLSPAQQLDVVGHDFGGVFLHSGLVGVLAGAQTPFNENLGSLMDEFFCQVCGIAPCDYVVPLRIFPGLAVAVPVSFSGGKGECGDLEPAPPPEFPSR